MKKVNVLETYNEVKKAMMSGKDISFEICTAIEEPIIPERTSKYTPGDFCKINGNEVIYAGQIYGDHKYKDVFVSLKDLVQKDEDGKDTKYFTHSEAEKAANNGDFHFPSKRELQLIALNIEAINAGLKANKVEELSDNYYWSSSVNPNYNIIYYVVNPVSGDTVGNTTGYSRYVRPVLVL